jgi:tetratricopeptide (TPR) repeat protein
LQFFTGYCHQSLGEWHEAMASELEEAIKLYESARDVYAKTDQVRWARTQNNLGIAYSESPGGDRAGNLQKAIDAFQAALRVKTEKDFPFDWAETQNNLGIAYSELPGGDRSGNLQKAIDAYEAALRVRTEKDFPFDWAITQYNLGLLFAGQSTGDRIQNLEKAKSCFEAALRVWSEKGFPDDHRDASNHLAIIEQEIGKLEVK